MEFKTTGIEGTVGQYMEAFETRDATRCVSFFSDDAVVKFLNNTFRGRQGLETWHRERFNADLRILQVNRVQPTTAGLDVDVVVTSKVLKAWGMPHLGGRVKFAFEDDKIISVAFQMLSAGGKNYIWARK